MSHKQAPSSFIPPPNDYTPQSSNRQHHHSHSGKFRGGRGDHRGGRDWRHANHGQPANITQLETQTHEQLKMERLINQPKDKFHRDEHDDYFANAIDDEDEQHEQAEKYSLQNASSQEQKSQATQDDEEEDDPLDAYMKSLEQDGESQGKEEGIEASQIEADAKNNNNNTLERATSEKKAVRLDIEGTDDAEESYYNYVEQAKQRQSATSANNPESDALFEDEIEYDKEGNILSAKRAKREIDPLQPIDHSLINYDSFEKNFYKEHRDISNMTDELSEELRTKLEIKVSGQGAPKPVCSFAHFNFDEQLMKVIRRSEYVQPTPIQAQAIPAALMGRNIIGVALTGSGKTAAYLWPMIVHIMGQPDLKTGDGPIGLVLVPTRELALQVYGQAKKFSSTYNINVVCAYGGGSKYEQSKDLEAGAEVVVATPGRLIDLIKAGVTSLTRVTYLVLDEADRFFELGFEAQARSICDHVRPDRQILLFSATFKKRIEQLARTVTENPVKIVQKSLGEANEDVSQHVIVMADLANKWDWLLSKIVEFTSAGSVLIFVTRIVNCEELHRKFKEESRETLLLHGDMDQVERNKVIMSFKRKELDVMITTDVAARGLDISHIRTVINYDVARDIDTHTHRIGRTGRAGAKGDAYTLLTDKDKEFAGHLVKNLQASNQQVDPSLIKLAMQSHAFRRSQFGAKGSSYQHHQHHQHKREHSQEHHGSYKHHNKFQHQTRQDDRARDQCGYSGDHYQQPKGFHHQGYNNPQSGYQAGRNRSPHRSGSSGDQRRHEWNSDDQRKMPKWA